uniref:Uncharacterized protein n=1 Tax=Strongyloides venezuelensis TaxID=75913 RepID=A0A0K0FYN3_STRVS
MKRCINLTNILRFILFILFISLIIKDKEKTNDEIISSKIKWLDIDLKIPKPLNNFIYEATRLNEFLATDTEKCQNKNILDEIYDNYYYCWDEKYFNNITLRKALYFSGHNKTKILFGQKLNITQWYAFLIKNNPVINTLSGDTNFKAIDEMTYGNLDVWSMISLFHNDELLLTRLEPYSDIFVDREKSYFKAVDIVDYLLPFIKSKFLQIEIKIGGKNASDITFQWYSLLYKLHFKYNFIVFGANSNGYCNRNYKENCIFYISLVKDDSTTTGPIFGLGSNDEERKRLITFIYKLPLKYKGTLTYNLCETKNTSKTDRNINAGSHLTDKELSNLFMNKEKCITIDLGGTGWKAMDAILNNCQKIKSLTLKIYIWFGEESLHYRKYYVYLLKLQKCGLEIYLDTNPNPYTFTIVLHRSTN